MKKLLLLLVFISPFFSKAQTNVYHPFPDSNAVWGMIGGCIDGFCGDWGYFKDYYDGDTIIDGFAYKKIYSEGIQMTGGSCCPYPGTAGTGYLREDTLARKVYWRTQWMNTDTLLYDFTLNIGDTLRGYLEYCGSGVPVTVQSIDSIFINTSFRKRINFDTSDFCMYYSIIEGIGSTTGLTGCYFGHFETGIYLNCFSINDTIMYVAPCNGDTVPCGALPSGIVALDSKIKISITPNPTHNSFTITSPFQNARVEIYNMLGEKVYSDLTPACGRQAPPSPKGEGCTVSLDVRPGIYLVKVSDGEQVAVQKLIIE
jgi:hypothetical protein